MPSLFGRLRRHFRHGSELGAYRNDLWARTERIDAILADAAGTIDLLRRRGTEPDVAVVALGEQEHALLEETEGVRDMMAPGELHALHEEYEANLERASRGIVLAARGCAITRLPHRPPEDEEPYTYFKRGHGNVTNARLRIQELVAVMLDWEPGKPAEASLVTRLRDE